MNTLLFATLWTLHAAAWAVTGVMLQRQDTAGVALAATLAIALAAALSPALRLRRGHDATPQRNPDRYRIAIPLAAQR